MAAYSLSRKAAVDLDSIYEFTILQFGLKQAREYVLGLQECFKTLADQPLYGRSADELAPDLRLMEYRSHVVFYTPAVNGVTIVRVLHGSMDTSRHL